MCLPPEVTFRFLFGVFVSVGLLLVYRGCKPTLTKTPNKKRKVTSGGRHMLVPFFIP